MIEEPKSIEQINKYLESEISQSTKIQIANFAILWNCFEKYCDQKGLYVYINTNKILNYDDIIYRMQLSYNDDKFIDLLSNEFKEYLKTKNCEYRVDKVCNYFSMSFGQYNKIKNCILLNDDSNFRRDDLKVFMNVIKKVRNNMYHGSKDVRTLDSQIKLFELCNKMLVFILYKLKCEDVLKI